MRRALTTRYLDFWLLGGASIAVWLVMFGLEGLRTSWAVDEHYQHLTTTALSLSLLVNYPHFMASYKLAYSRGGAFVTTHWWQLLAVPVLLVAALAAAWTYYDVRVEQVPALVQASDVVRGWGANVQVLGGPRVGDLVLTLLFNVMILTLGWHYSKQAFGCMVVYAHYDGYALSPMQRRTLKWALLSLWAMIFVDYNLAGDFHAFRGFSYSALDLPDAAGPLTQLVAMAGVLLAARIFWHNYRASGQRPSATMLAPFVALYLWWMPQTRQEEYFFLLVPLFHGIQYLAFAYRMEDARLRGAPNRERQATLLVMGLIVGGWLTFEFVPDSLDAWMGTFDAWRVFFFFIAVMLFVNIHHYFIDNVLWRFRDPRVREYLLS